MFTASTMWPLPSPSTHLGVSSSIPGATRLHSILGGDTSDSPLAYMMFDAGFRSKLASLANSISEEVQEQHKELYQPGTAKEVFGAWGIAGGATDDW